MRFSRILVAYDGSDLGEKALETAIKLAETEAMARIHVVHVISPLTYSYEYLDSDQVNEGIRRHGLEILGKAEQKLTGLQINQFKTSLLEGRPSDALLEYASDYHCHLIVMGSRGLGGIKEFFLGSVSHDILQRSSIPVFIVK